MRTLALVCCLLMAGAAFGADKGETLGETKTPVEKSMWSLPAHLGGDLLAAAAFGLLVILMVIGGYMLFDWASKVDFEAELAKGNIAVGIVVAATILGICYAVTHVVVAIIG